MKQIFTPFYRVGQVKNRNSGGSGLGLYITKTILDHHGIPYSMVNTEDGVRLTAIFRRQQCRSSPLFVRYLAAGKS